MCACMTQENDVTELVVTQGCTGKPEIVTISLLVPNNTVTLFYLDSSTCIGPK